MDTAELLAAARATYNLPAAAVWPVEGGYVARAFVVDDDDGRACWFVKLWPDTSVGRETEKLLAVSLPLARDLAPRVEAAAVIAPITTADGALSSQFAGRPYAVYPYAPGRPLRDPTADQWERMGRVLSEIHNATPALVAPLPPAERFDAGFEKDLRAALGRIKAGGGPADLRTLVAPIAGEIDEQLSALTARGRRLLAEPCALVLCHGDFGGDNLLVDEAGNLAVLDWDAPCHAPPEQDLWMVAHPAPSPHAERFFRSYLAGVGDADLRLERFEFFLRRRFLEDATARIVRLLDEDPGPVERPDLLDGIREWGARLWRRLDSTLDSIGAALSASRQPAAHAQAPERP